MITSTNLSIIQEMLTSAVHIKNKTVVKKIGNKIDEIWFDGEKLAYDDTPFIINNSPYMMEYIDFSDSDWRVIVSYDFSQYMTIVIQDNDNYIEIDQSQYINLTDDYKLNIDGLDKSVLDWNEEDLLYYTLKNS